MRAYLPAGAAVRVALVLEVGHILHHPLVDLAERESVVRRRADRLRDQVGVRQIAPGVAPRRVLLLGGGRCTGCAAARRRDRLAACVVMVGGNFGRWY